MNGHHDLTPTRVDAHHDDAAVELGGLAAQAVGRAGRPARPRVDVFWPNDETLRLLD